MEPGGALVPSIGTLKDALIQGNRMSIKFYATMALILLLLIRFLYLLIMQNLKRKNKDFLDKYHILLHHLCTTLQTNSLTDWC